MQSFKYTITFVWAYVALKVWVDQRMIDEANTSASSNAFLVGALLHANQDFNFSDVSGAS